MISPRDLAFIGCRFVAIYFVFKSISMLGYIAAVLLSLATSSGNTTPLYSFLAPFSLFLTLSWGFWSGAKWLSERIAKGTSTGGEATSWGRNEAVSAGVSLFGLLLLVFALARVPGLLANMDIRGNTPVSFYLDVAIFFIAALFMIIQPQGIANVLNKIRRTGTEN